MGVILSSKLVRRSRRLILLICALIPMSFPDLGISAARALCAVPGCDSRNAGMVALRIRYHN